MDNSYKKNLDRILVLQWISLLILYIGYGIGRLIDHKACFFIGAGIGLIAAIIFLANKKYRNEFGEWEFSLTNTNLIRIVEHSLEQINTLLEETNKINNMNNPRFEVIWIRKDPEATNGKGCKLKEFRFRLKNKQDNRNINLKFNR